MLAAKTDDVSLSRKKSFHSHRTCRIFKTCNGVERCCSITCVKDKKIYHRLATSERRIVAGDDDCIFILCTYLLLPMPTL
jgi:hypothetical protein